MTEPPEDRPQEKSPPNINHVPSVLKHRTRIALAFITLCACTGLILFTGPGFPFALQVVLSTLLLFFLFWLVT